MNRLLKQSGRYNKAKKAKQSRLM